MKESEFNDQVKVKLHEFETIADIKPSDDWNLTLMKNLDSVPHQTSRTAGVRLIVIVIAVVIINMGLILNSIVREPGQAQLRSEELQSVVSEFLINPVSLNN